MDAYWPGKNHPAPAKGRGEPIKADSFFIFTLRASTQESRKYGEYGGVFI